MDRRTFLCASSATILNLSRSPLFAGTFDAGSNASDENCIFASTNGSDQNPGTESRPLKTFEAVQTAVVERKKQTRGALTVYFRAGTYYLPETVVFTTEHSGQQDAPIAYSPYPGEQVVLSGGSRISTHWTDYRNGIMQTPVPPGTDSEQLFVNGERQILARYPNYDSQAKYLNGYAADAVSRERVARWANPKGGYIHALHQYLWGDQHYIITGKDADGNLTYEGGWQNNRPKPMHSEYRFVENIFEELDSPGEWFLDKEKNILYYYPPAGVDLNTAVTEVVRLRHLVEFRGTAESPVRWITLRGFDFRHASRTFMEIREPLLRSDWRIYRGGALFFTGAEDCDVTDCTLDQLGGNAVFVNNYNRRVHITGCHIAAAGGNGICFVGDRSAVRNALNSYDDRHAIGDLDETPGPLSANYPEDCLVEDCLIYQTGRVEKQSAPIEIDISKSITVRHASIYDVPRAGINIGDGCFGGHHIDFCDVFDTVKETGDHGSFNSWARDRWWGVTGFDLDSAVDGDHRMLPVLDALEPNVLSNSRWRCDHGWDIDLDDGSTNYHIYNNLCLNGGLKLREGFYRICDNNILVNNSLHPHVWYNDSHDIFRSNIVFTPYRPIKMRAWTQEIDFNMLHKPGQQTPDHAQALSERSGQDAHSLVGDAEFVDAATGDYRVKPGSPAFRLGFVNFNMQQFGVRSPRLKGLARQPELPTVHSAAASASTETRGRQVMAWAGATVRNIVGPDEVSASGTPGEVGVILLDVPESSDAARAGFLPGDVILAINDKAVEDVGDLLRASRAAAPGESGSVTILRFQQESKIRVSLRE
jgi:PDZ domain